MIKLVLDICATGFINCTDALGSIIYAGVNTTGSMFGVLFCILLFLMILCITFNIDFTIISLFLIPLCLACVGYYREFLAPLIVILIYISILMAKNWIFK